MSGNEEPLPAKRKRYQYTTDQLEKAVSAIQNGMTISQAAQQYKVPWSTLKVKSLKNQTGELKKVRRTKQRLTLFSYFS